MIYFACPDPLSFLSGGNMLNAQIFRAFREAGRAYTRIDWQDIQHIAFTPKDFLFVDSFWINKLQPRDCRKIQAFKIFFTPLLPSMLDPDTDRKKELERLFCFDILLANSPFTGTWLDTFMSGKSRIETIQPWIKKTEIEPGSDRDRFILVANWQPVKQIHLFLQALAEADLPEGLKIHFFGDRKVNESYTMKCMEILKNYPGMNEHIILEGPVSHDLLESVYAGSKCLIDTSLFETYGMALAEALVNGLQVLALGRGNIINLIGQGRGMICRDMDDLVQAAGLILKGKLSLAENPVQDILTSWPAFVKQFAFLDQIHRA